MCKVQHQIECILKIYNLKKNIMNFYFSFETMIKKNVVLLVFKKHNIFYIIFVVSKCKNASVCQNLELISVWCRH